MTGAEHSALRILPLPLKSRVLLTLAIDPGTSKLSDYEACLSLREGVPNAVGQPLRAIILKAVILSHYP